MNHPLVLRADARSLPLPDACVDLVVTSPPYFGLRDYGYDGQIGSEATPGAWLASLLECTAEMMRVLKPSGSIFVNLGDKYNSAASGQNGLGASSLRGHGGDGTTRDRALSARRAAVPAMREKSLLGLPWRYALACTDQLGLILRAEIIWAKPNGLPESVTDRVRRNHEQIFHFTRQPRYYSAVDEIREGYAPGTAKRYAAGYNPRAIDGQRLGIGTNLGGDTYGENPLGKLPGSVWDIPSQPLTVPALLGVDHFAAYPMELPRRIIAGWSPPGVCTACGEGRRPVVEKRMISSQRAAQPRSALTRYTALDRAQRDAMDIIPRSFEATIIGHSCACAPRSDCCRGLSHRVPGGDIACTTCGSDFVPLLPPTRPAIVLDPFMGTGTTLLVAAALGRHAIGTDLSADYCRLARWRCADPAERARAMQVPKPPPVPDGQEALFTL